MDVVVLEAKHLRNTGTTQVHIQYTNLDHYDEGRGGIQLKVAVRQRYSLHVVLRATVAT